MTEEEKQDVIDRAVEKALLLLPEVVGNLIVSHVAMNKLTTDFYRQHPEFREHKEALASLVEMVEGRNPGMKYEDILKRVALEMPERIRITQPLNTTTVNRSPSRHLPELSLKTEVESPHGTI